MVEKAHRVSITKSTVRRGADQAAGRAPISVLSRRVSELLDIQEQLGAEVLDSLDERWSDWIDELANETRLEVGGW